RPLSEVGAGSGSVEANQPERQAHDEQPHETLYAQGEAGCPAGRLAEAPARWFGDDALAEGDGSGGLSSAVGEIVGGGTVDGAQAELGWLRGVRTTWRSGAFGRHRRSSRIF